MWYNTAMVKDNKNKNGGGTGGSSETTPVVVENGLIANRESGVSVAHETLPDRINQPVASSSSAPTGPRRITEIRTDEVENSMSGGFASVKGTRKSESKLVWIVLAVMCVMCIAVGVLSSVLTAFFMRKGNTPPAINTEDVKQNISAVVAARKPSVVEVKSTGLRGSGVIMKYENNKVYVLTNYHVIAGGAPAVRFGGEDAYYESSVVGYNEYYDIAVVTVTHTPVAAVFDLDGSEYFKAAVKYAEGDYVVAIGNAMSMGLASYDGIISRNYDILKYSGKFVPVMRTTAAINAGMSGGGLFDMSGNFLGLCTYRMSSYPENAEHTPSNDVEDTAFVVPASVVYPVYKQILDKGTADEDVGLIDMRFFDSTSTSPVGGMSLAELGITCEFREGGLTVARVDSGIAPRNIAVGDVITKIGSVAVTNDVCKVAGAFLHYRPNSAGGTTFPSSATLHLEVKRGSSTLDIEFERVYRYVGA